MFSVIYWTYGTSGNFSSRLTHLDAIYFTMGTLSTAGTGNIVSVSQLARGLQTLQMLLDLGFLLVAVTWWWAWRCRQGGLEGVLTVEDDGRVKVRSLIKGEPMAGKFVLKQGSSGKYHFNLVAGNGRSSPRARPMSARSRRSTASSR